MSRLTFDSKKREKKVKRAIQELKDLERKHYGSCRTCKFSEPPTKEYPTLANDIERIHCSKIGLDTTQEKIDIVDYFYCDQYEEE